MTNEIPFEINFSASDIRDGAITCLIANLMEQLTLDQAADVYHQARRIAYACPAFPTEVKMKEKKKLHIFPNM